MYCVVVGDIIHSKSLDQDRRSDSADAINRVLGYINNKYENSILASFGVVRGDAFEGVLFSQQAAPKIIQEIVMGLYEEDVRVRISAAMGELSVISAERNKADGPAFYAALNRIEDLRKADSDHWFQISMLIDSIAQPLVDGLLQMLTALTEGWTRKQANAVWTMIRCENKQALVSEKLGVKPPVVSKHLKAARYEAYHAAWTGLERYLIELEEKSVSAPTVSAPTYTTYFSLANRKTEQEDFLAAVAFYKEALALATEEFGKESPNLVRIYNGLTNAYLELLQNSKISAEDRKEYFDLIDEYIKAALSCQSALPKNRLEYARTIALNGDFLALHKKNAAALAKYIEAINVMEYCDCPEPEWIFECYNNMAIIYGKQGNEQKALEAITIALEYAERNKELAPVSYAAALHNLGMLYAKLNKADESIKMLNTALQMYTSLLPSKDRRIAIVKKQLQQLQEK